jgi:hypothetical protein
LRTGANEGRSESILCDGTGVDFVPSVEERQVGRRVFRTCKRKTTTHRRLFRAILFSFTTFASPHDTNNDTETFLCCCYDPTLDGARPTTKRGDCSPFLLRSLERVNRLSECLAAEHVDEPLPVVDAAGDVLLDLWAGTKVSLGREKASLGEETHLEFAALDELGDDVVELGEVEVTDDEAYELSIVSASRE